MPQPLIIKRPEPASAARGAAVTASVAVPLLTLVGLTVTDHPVHLDHPVVNLVAHLILLFLPVAWATGYITQRIEVLPNNETVLARGTIWSSFTHTWWMTIMLWPAPLVAFHVLGRRGLLVWQEGAAALTTSPFSALLIMILTFAMSVFYGTMALERKEVRVSDEGLRTDLLHFVEWHAVHHVRKQDGAYDIFHAANPRVPFGCIVLKDPDARSVFEEYLYRFNINERRSVDTTYHVVRAVSLVAAIALLEAAVALEVNAVFRGPWLIIATFVAGLGMTTVLERFRRVSRITRIKPRVGVLEPVEPEPPALDEIKAIQIPTDFCVALSAVVLHRFREIGFEHLNQAEQVVHCVDGLAREVNNGGFEQFFANPSGDHAAETADALERVGAPRTADLVRRALALFPGGMPAPDGDTRASQLEAVDAARLRELDDAFLGQPEPLEELLRRYALAHWEHFEELP